MADVHGTTASRSASWHSLFHDGVPRELTQSRGRRSPKHRSSCSRVEEDLAAATVMDGSTLPAIDALPSDDAISKAPRAAGYRGSDFVLWHDSAVLALQQVRQLLGVHLPCIGRSWLRNRWSSHPVPEALRQCSRAFEGGPDNPPQCRLAGLSHLLTFPLFLSLSLSADKSCLSTRGRKGGKGGNGRGLKLS